MPHASGSGLALLRSCQWWAREDLPALQPEEVGRAAVVGTATHARIAAALGLAEPLLDALTAEERATVAAQTECAVNWIASRTNLVRMLNPEVAYAWSVQDGKARRILPRHPRDYSEVNRATEIPCTIDAIAHLHPSQSALVLDWKTGRAAHVEPPRDNAQLLLGALCARSIFGVAEVEIGIVYLGDGSEPARYVSAVVSDLELDAFAEELRRLWAAVPTASATPGPHCTERYCKRLGQCPATSSALAALTGEDGPHGVVVDAAAITSAAHAAWLLRAVKLARAVAAKAETAVRDYATAHGGAVDLGDGRAYTTEPGYARIDARRALPVLEAEGLDLDLAAPRSTSKDAIGEAVKARGGKVAPEVRRIVAALEAAGAVERGADRWAEVRR